MESERGDERSRLLPSSSEEGAKIAAHGEFSLSEAKAVVSQLLQLCGPVTLALFNFNLLSLQIILFCGHLGALELDAAALAVSFTSVIGLSVMLGLSSACDTLFSQAYGSSNKKRVGVYLQQSLLILGFVALPLGGLWLNTEVIMLLAGQNADVSRLAGQFSTISAASFLPITIYTVLGSYLRNQGLVTAPFVFGLLGNAVAALTSYICIYVLDYGVEGAAIGYNAGVCTVLASALVYIFKWKVYRETWDGWTWDCLREWGKFAGLAIPGMIMTCVDWWGYEVIILFAGMIGKVSLAITAVIFRVDTLFMMPAYGVAIASTITVGNHLGAGELRQAELASYAAVLIAAVFSFIVVALFISLSDYLALMFTHCKVVVDGVGDLMPVIAFMEVFNYLQITFNGVFRGCGKQLTGAVIRVIGYLFILPPGIPLALLTVLKTSGLWIASIIGLFVMVVLSLIVLLNSNWSELSYKAQIRVGAISTVPEHKEGKESILVNKTENDEAKLTSSSQIPPAVSSSEAYPELLPGDQNTRLLTVSQQHSQRPSGLVLIKRCIYMVTCLLLLAVAVLVRVNVIPNGLGQTSNSTAQERSCPSAADN